MDSDVYIVGKIYIVLRAFGQSKYYKTHYFQQFWGILGMDYREDFKRVLERN